ncbi:acyl-coenzyme A thioesterase THEM4 [Neosynchiropus ocellatus]
MIWSLCRRLTSCKTPCALMQECCVRTLGISSTCRLKPRDYSLPNSSWSPELMRLYEHYSSQCEVETETGEKKKGPWMKVPSYNRFLTHARGGVILSKIYQAKARIFTRNIKTPGAGFEFAVFVNKEEEKCDCVLQLGHLLEGPPGHVHGGAVATIMDEVMGSLATYIAGPCLTANLNVNYRSPVPLGSTVLLQSSLVKREGRKLSLTCQITSPDGSKLHTEATALFLVIKIGLLL